jgi:hypothetical protein
VRMPSARAVPITRTAISPRLAMSTEPNIAADTIYRRRLRQPLRR